MALVSYSQPLYNVTVIISIRTALLIVLWIGITIIVAIATSGHSNSLKILTFVSTPLFIVAAVSILFDQIKRSGK